MSDLIPFEMMFVIENILMTRAAELEDGDNIAKKDKKAFETAEELKEIIHDFIYFGSEGCKCQCKDKEEVLEE